jgi:Lsr2
VFTLLGKEENFTMAKKVQVLLVDDYDGTDAEETVSFALDGVSYEIDLSAENAEALRESLAEWVGHARRVGGRTASRARVAARPRAAKTDLGEVRVWARDNGYQVSDRGRISAEVMAAYEAAH